MSNKIQKTVEFKFTSDVTNVTQSVNQLEQKMRNVKMPENSAKGILSQITKLKTELAKVQSQTKDGVVKIDEADAVAKSGQKIKSLYTELIAKVKQLGTLSNKEMRELFPEEIANQINGAEKAMDNYAKAIKNANKEIKKQEEALKDAQKLKEQASKDLSIGKSKKVVSDEVSKSRSRDLKKHQATLDRKSELESDYQRIASKAGTRKDGGVSRRGMSEADKAIVNEYEEVSKAAERAAEEIKEIKKAQSESITTKELERLEKAYTDAGTKVEGLQGKLNNLKSGKNTSFNELIQQVKELGVNTDGIQNIEQLKEKINGMDAENIEKIKVEMKEFENSTEEVKGQVDGLGDKIGDEFKQAADSTKQANKNFDEMSKKVQLFFGMSNAIQLFKRTLREAFNSVKELDAAMTKIAVVSDYSVGDMWESLPTFTKRANELGVAITDVYDATGLYVQQGLDLVESQGLANETLKMAKIAGMDAAAATDAMTSALRGFNMELNEASAQKVNDIYSKLAAITASDTQEIATAMSKTASIASNAGASIENTAAFLSQIIETTRESAETAGTALKTVIARFSELKKDPSEIGDVDGEIVDANAIESALKLAGVQLRDTSGQFKEFDQVIIELSGKWDSLDKNTQRYIATMAAGSRQQSRFLALMSDNERLMQLTDAAYNSTGASQTQFNKTLDSMESKLNQLKNAWDTFTRNLMNSSLLKTGVDILTKVLNAINGITNAFQSLGSVAGTILSGTLMATFFLLGKQIAAKLATSAKNGLVSFFTDVLQQFQTQTGLIGAEGGNAGKQFGTQFETNSESSINNWYQNFSSKIGTLKQELSDLSSTMNTSTATGDVEEILESKKYTAGQDYVVVKEHGDRQSIRFNGDEGGMGYQKDGKIYDPNWNELGEVAPDNIPPTKTPKKPTTPQQKGIKALPPGSEGATTEPIKKPEPTPSEQTPQLEGKEEPLLLTDGTQKQLDEANKKTEKLKINTQKLGAAFIAAGMASSLLAQQLRKNGNEKGAEVVEKVGAGLTTIGMALTTIGPLITSVGKALKNMTVGQMKSIGKWTIILAIVTAIFMIIKNIANIISKNSLNGKLKSITDATQKATETAQKAQEAYSNWLSDKNEYNGLIEALEELTEGTAAWEEQMDKVQDKIYEMINTYPELAKYVKDGKIDNQGLQELDERLKKEKQLALSNKVGVQMTKDELQYQKDIKDLNEEKRKNKDSSKDENYWNKRFEELENNYNKNYQGNVNFLLQNSGIDASMSDNITSALTKQNGSHSYGSNAQKAIDQTGGKYNTHQSVENAAWWTAGGTAATMAGIGMVNGAAALSAMTASAGAAAAAAAGGATAAAATAAGTAAATAAATAATGMAATAATTVATAATTAATAAATAAAGGATVAAATAAGTAAAGGATTALVAGLSAIPVAGWIAAAAVAVTAITVGVVKAIQKNKKKKDIQKAYADMLGKSIEDIDKDTLKDVDKMSAELAAYEQNKILEQKAKETEAEIQTMGTDAIKLFAADMSLLDQDFGTQGFENWVETLKNGVSELTKLSLEHALEEFNAERKRVTEAVNDIFGGIVGLRVDGKNSVISGALGQQLADAQDKMKETFGAKAASDINSVMQVYATSQASINEMAEGYIKLNSAATLAQKALASKKLAESGQANLVALSVEFESVTNGMLSATNQVKEFYMNLTSDKLNELFKDGELTATSLYGMTGAFKDLDAIVETTEVSMGTLAIVLNDLRSGILSVDNLTQNFVKTLDTLNKSSVITQDSIARAKNFKEGDSGTLFGEKAGEISKKLSTIFAERRFNDPIIEDYFDFLFGEDAWDKALKDAGRNAEEALSKYMASIRNIAEDQNFEDFWAGTADVSGGLWSHDGDKISFNLEGFDTLEDYINKIAELTGFSKDFIEAAISDAQTWSRDFKNVVDKMNTTTAFNEYLNGLKVVNGQVSLDIKQLQEIYKSSFADGKSVFGTETQFIEWVKNTVSTTLGAEVTESNLTAATSIDELRNTFKNESAIQGTYTENYRFQKAGTEYGLTTLGNPSIQSYKGDKNEAALDIAKQAFTYDYFKTTLSNNGKDWNESSLAQEYSRFVEQYAEAIKEDMWSVDQGSKYGGQPNGNLTWYAGKNNLDDVTIGASGQNVDNVVSDYTKLLSQAQQMYMNQGLSVTAAIQKVREEFGTREQIASNLGQNADVFDDTELYKQVSALVNSDEELVKWMQGSVTEEDAKLINQADLINQGTLKAVQYYLKATKHDGDLPSMQDYQIDAVKILNTVGVNHNSGKQGKEQPEVRFKLSADEMGLISAELLDSSKVPAYDGVTEEEAKNMAKDIDFDWLNNLNELAEEAVRNLEKYETEYELAIKNRNKTEDQRLNMMKGQFSSLETEKVVLQRKADLSQKHIEGMLQKNSELTPYTWQEDGKTMIDWNKIDEAKKNGNLTEKISKLFDDIKKHNDVINESEQRILDIELEKKAFIEELDKTIIDFKNEVKDMVISEYQKEITKLEDIDSSINDANAKLIDSIQSSVDRYRRDRDNEKTEGELEDKQNRLALLRADTTGANQQAIRELEKELGEAQEDYTDTLIDQKISALQEQNEEASEQRQQQIDIANAQLESIQENGTVNAIVQDILDASTTFDGSPLQKLWKENMSTNGLFGDEWRNDIGSFEETATEFYDADKFKKMYGDGTNISDSVATAVGDVLDNEETKITKAITGWKILTADEITGAITAALNKQNPVTTTGASSSTTLSSLFTGSDLSKKLQTSSNGTNVTTEAKSFIKSAKDSGIANQATIDAYLKSQGIVSDGNNGYKVQKATTGSASTSTVRGNTSASSGLVQSTTIHPTNSQLPAGFYASPIALEAQSGNYSHLFYSRGEGRTKYDIYDTKYGEFKPCPWKDVKNAVGTNVLKYLGTVDSTEMRNLNQNYAKYKTGGLNTYTGPAWLDGTPSKPELVLNAQDTQNFLQLKDILSSIIGNGFSNSTTQKDGDINLEIHLNVEQGISSDYDVEKLVTKVKQEIARVGQERNIQILTKR